MSTTQESAENEQAEAMRVGNLLAAAVQACFYALLETDNPPFPPESAFTPIKFKKISGAGGKLIQQHTGWTSVHIEAPDPVFGWIPARMTFHVRPGFLKDWKNIVVTGLNATYAELQEVLNTPETDEDFGEIDENAGFVDDGSGLSPEMQQKMRETIAANIRNSHTIVPGNSTEAVPAPGTGPETEEI
jgi:hypothetical protein